MFIAIVINIIVLRIFVNLNVNLFAISRVLDHPNLCKFIGATVKDPINLVIITEYCPKGSLNDVLQNEDIPLNWGFRFSFSKDVACGVTFLHHKKIHHNQLTSSNCVIDDRWTIKITGKYMHHNNFEYSIIIDTCTLYMYIHYRNHTCMNMVVK